MKKIIFTTSWDDGDKLDLKLADLLGQYGVKATFYIPKKFNNRLSDEDISHLSRRQEIGAHTINHLSLDKINPEEAWREIAESKNWLDGLLNRETKMFCYPRGHYNDKIKNLVVRAGFIGARTVANGDNIDDVFQMPVSVQTYPFPLRRRSADKIHWSKFLLQPLIGNYGIIKKYNLPLKSFLSWPNFARSYFSAVRERGGVFHLWGHSWEIEKYQMWGQLEELLQFVSQKDEALYLTNSQAIEYANNNIK